VPESAEVTRAVEHGLMRAIDVAAFLGVSRQRVDQLSDLGRLPPSRLVDRRRMWKRTRIEAWADQHWWGTRPWRLRPG
jgi:predicted DNA-binding transcriptional regulator AlpA